MSKCHIVGKTNVTAHICNLLRRLSDAKEHIEKCILGEFRKHNKKYHDFTEKVIRFMALESC